MEKKRFSIAAIIAAASGIFVLCFFPEQTYAQGLANSAWPMFRQNPQHTGRSSIVAPAAVGTPKWKYKTGDRIISSPAIESDGTIYVGSQDSYLYALNPNGALKWRYQTGNVIVDSSPVIASDGTVYVGSNDGYLYAINSNGTLKWKYQTGALIYSSPVIASDGTIYVGSDDNYLYAINSNGTLKWKYMAGNRVYSSPAIASDGTVYVGSVDDYLYAIKPDGTLKWKYQTYDSGYGILSSPTIESDGTVYVGSGDYLYAINQDGTLKWKYQTGGIVYSSPAIASDHTIYVGSDNKYLNAINQDGTLKWKYQTGNIVHSSPAIASDGTIYVGSHDNYFNAINPNGTLKWKYLTSFYVHSSPAIASDGTVYVGSYDGYLYAFGHLALTSPNGSESWTVGTSHSITWNSFGIANVKIEYSTNNGSTWTTIIASIAASAGTYTWTVPNIPSTQCLVRISDVSNTTVNDQSDRPFTNIIINKGTLAVSAPATASAGASFTVEVKAQDVTDLFGSSFVLTWNQEIYIDCINAEQGDFLGGDIIFFTSIDASTKSVSVGISRKAGQTNVSGTGVLARITFTSKAETPINTVVVFSLNDITANKADGGSLQLAAVKGSTNITTGVTVWPGDTNNDGKVNQSDILPLGLYWNKTGPVRINHSTAWSGQVCQPWSPEAATYADANGDGTVNQSDVLAIGLNWGKTHAVFKKSVEKPAARGTIILVPQTTLPISAGTEFYVDVNAKDATNLFGVSFVLTYDGKDLIEPVSAEAGTFLGNDVIFFPQVDAKSDNIAVGISQKSGQSGTSGEGTVVRVKFKATKAIETGTRITFMLTDITANNSTGGIVNITSISGYLGNVGVNDSVPVVYFLGQNTPNPFNPNTSITYTLRESGSIRLDIYNVSGQLVRTLVDEYQKQGHHSIVWNGRDDNGMKVSAGIYFYRLNSGGFIQTRKMLLLP